VHYVAEVVALQASISTSTAFFLERSAMVFGSRGGIAKERLI
jgi:hypothetical protein